MKERWWEESDRGCTCCVLGRKTEMEETEMMLWSKDVCVVVDDAVEGMACGGQNGQPQG